MQILQSVRARRSISTRRTALHVELLENRLTPANQPPLAPVITEPTVNGVVVSPFDVHMVIGPFSDPNLGDSHLATDWEIWTTTATPEKVWAANNITDAVGKFHIHQADGVFINSLAGQHELLFETDYRLQVRVRDSSGDAATEWSAWSSRLFQTQAELQPDPSAGTWAVAQAGYKVEVVAGGFQLPVNIAFVPNPDHHAHDPLFYVAELYGQIKVVTNDGHVSTYASGLLNFDPTGDFPGTGEQGVAGIVVDPATGDLFVTLLYASGDHYPKVVRFHSEDGGLTAATQTTILDMPNESMGQSHQISNISFGPDGKLYVHVGDGFNDTIGQNLDSFRGKILRLNLDGSAPEDNPFYNAADGSSARDYVFAYGFRNPFGGDWRDADGKHYSVENGPSVDRLTQVVAGRNYLYDGSDASMTNYAIYNWSPAVGPVNLAFIQESSFGGSRFPASKLGHLFVSESGPTFASGPQPNGKKISEIVLDANGNLVQGPTTLISYNGTGKGTVVGLAAGPDGLYFTDLYADSDPNPTAFGANVLRVRYIGTAAPVAPSSLSAVAVSTGQINLTWTDQADNEQGFRIEQSTDGINYVQIATVDANHTDYSVTGLLPGTTYWYRVRGFNSDFGNGGYSSVASAVTQGTAGQPAVPGGVSAAAGNGLVIVSWIPAAGATSYNVYRATTSGGQGATPIATGITGNSFTNTGLTNGTMYFYTVTAVNAAGQSAPSSEVSATPIAPPAAPSGLSAVAGDGQVTLSWTASAGASSYAVYRGTSSGDQGSTPFVIVATTSFTDSTANNGTTYFYKVSALNAGGESPQSSEASATPTAPLIDVRINFQPQGAAIPAGYLADTGFVFGNRGNGFFYGWNQDNSGGARDRDNAAAPDQRYDTFNHMSGLTWEIEVPNGTYTVRLVAGDPSYVDSVYRINVENILLINGTPTAANQWIEGTTTVAVTDGRLTITNAGGASNNKVAFIDIATGGISVPGAPTGLTATPGIGQVALAWTGVAGAGSYNVYRSTTSEGQGTTPVAAGITATSFVDNGVSNGVTYFYKVSAANAAGEGPRSVEASATPSALPAAPTGLNAVAGNAQASLSWSAVAGASSYRVYRSTTSGGQGTTPIATHITATSFVDTGLTNGVTYFYKVSAVNGSGEGPQSSEASATPVALGFEAHINFQPQGTAIPAGYVADVGSVFANRGNGYTYGWAQDNAAGARDRNNAASPDQRYDTFNHMAGQTWEIAVANGSYTVRIVAGDPDYLDSTYRINVEGTLAINGTPTAANRWLEATVTVNVADGRLTVTNAAGASNNKISFIDITLGGLAVPAAPTNLAASPGNGQVALSWAGSPGAAAYNIYRATTSGGQGATPLASGVTATLFTDNSVINGVTYFYKVSAVNDAGASPLSAEVSATPNAVPATPTGLSAVAGNAQVSLSWGSAAGATSYNVFRATLSGGQGTTPFATGITATSFVDSAATNGVTYFYKVSAVNDAGQSALSTEVSATPSATGFEAHVNFQPQGVAVPAGYVADTGETFANRGNGLIYGWNASATGDTRDRNSAASADQRYDTLTHFSGRTWEIAVANGSYTVRVVAGDAAYLDSVHVIQVEGAVAINGTPTAANRWLEGTVTVTVSDGRLTVSAGAGAVNSKINFIDISAVVTTQSATLAATTSISSAETRTAAPTSATGPGTNNITNVTSTATTTTPAKTQAKPVTKKKAPKAPPLLRRKPAPIVKAKPQAAKGK